MASFATERGFTKFLNFVYSSPYSVYNDELPRKKARDLYYGRESEITRNSLVTAIEKNTFSIKVGKNIHSDLMARKVMIDMLLCHQSIWLKLAISCVFEELVYFERVEDFRNYFTLKMFPKFDIAVSLVADDKKKKVEKSILKRFLTLIWFLDKLKCEEIIAPSTCLFKKDSEYKSSSAILVKFNQLFLEGEGDVLRHLKFAVKGFEVVQEQSFFDEYEYRVKNLAVDLRDGVRLCRLIEVLTQKWEYSQQLRVPPVDPMQKQHNIRICLNAAKENGLNFGPLFKPKDIVSGNQEKTLLYIW